MSDLIKEYDRARLQIHLYGAEEEKDQLHLYNGQDRHTAFLAGLLVGSPVFFGGLIAISQFFR